MRFYIGETDEGDFPAGPRHPVVVEFAEGGLRGTLRFAATEEVLHATLWAELHKVSGVDCLGPLTMRPLCKAQKNETPALCGTGVSKTEGRFRVGDGTTFRIRNVEAFRWFLHGAPVFALQPKAAQVGRIGAPTQRDARGAKEKEPRFPEALNRMQDDGPWLRDQSYAAAIAKFLTAARPSASALKRAVGPFATRISFRKPTGNAKLGSLVLHGMSNRVTHGRHS